MGHTNIGKLNQADGTRGIRPLRSWSSSEQSAPRDAGNARRFSVGGSSSVSRKAHTPRSLPTWAEEEEVEMQQAAQAVRAQRLAASSSSSSGSSGARRRISIPSMVGSPLSFTQSFLASRSSMYAKHPPSSQLRAAHIDWDSLSMDEAGWPAWPLPAMRAHAGGPHILPPALHKYPLPVAPAQPLRLRGAPRAAWDYACLHHPLLTSFAVASPNRLPVRWRWCLLSVVAALFVCVAVGLPAALAVLMAI
ncbi:hypothetical protein IWW36_003243 [Coemansia brasiliensis]|uniref:Uncharacterized protein n=1 Tax=Coemansia brasiliensis TaxID=2650707 RepID=A0A9W8IC00_9FUNG|nr:hypothetical protein IWW36_003243 [Coemansia brasiliensis]